MGNESGKYAGKIDLLTHNLLINIKNKALLHLIDAIRLKGVYVYQ